jgi:hypothetical protein
MAFVEMPWHLGFVPRADGRVQESADAADVLVETLVPFPNFP